MIPKRSVSFLVYRVGSMFIDAEQRLPGSFN